MATVTGEAKTTVPSRIGRSGTARCSGSFHFPRRQRWLRKSARGINYTRLIVC